MRKVFRVLICILVIIIIVKFLGVDIFTREWDTVKTFGSTVLANFGINASTNDKNSDNFRSEREQFSEERILKWTQNDMFYLKIENKLFGTDYFKRDLNLGDYIYVGEMKKNMPNGKGIIYSVYHSDLGKKVFAPLYIGTFKDGVYNGYGRKFNKASVYYHMLTGLEYWNLDKLGIGYQEYEGYFRDGKYDGTGNYMIVDEVIEDEMESNLIKYSESNKTTINSFSKELSETEFPLLISDLPPLKTFVSYIGDFRDSNMNGKGKIFNKQNTLIYEGGFKLDSYYGQGKLYYSDGKIRYEGEFKNGKYDGYGTLYNEDGSIEYKGEWNSGDIE